MKHLTFFASLAIISAIATGCASRGYNRADSAATSVQKAATRVDVGAGQIDIALATLSDLVDNPGAELKPQFAKFDSAVSNLESLSKDMAKRSDAMQKKGTNYFEKWDEELARIQNEDIRSRSAARKTEVMQGFQSVQANYQNTSVALEPFIARLVDIRTAIGTDLTPAGLNAIRGSVGSIKSEGASVAQSLRNLSADFRSLGVSLSPSVPQPEQPAQPHQLETPAQPAPQTSSPSVGN